jgi:hypothetical protein
MATTKKLPKPKKGQLFKPTLELTKNSPGGPATPGAKKKRKK